MLRLAVLVLFLAALLAGCSAAEDNDRSSEDSTSPRPATQVSPPAGASQWDASAVFQYGPGVPSDTWQQGCGKSAVAIGAQEPCILQVMKLANASQGAVAFYQKQTYFLASFRETGRVDYGQGGAPWFNMGRPTPIVFLNGSPDIIEASVPQDYKTNPLYAKVLTPVTRFEGVNFPPTPWLEYGELKSVTSEPGGGQRFVIEFPLRDCRACADVGYLPIAYNFDTQGRLIKSETLALKLK
jgi:hypothetical protein